jgi:hypothetical protein
MFRFSTTQPQSFYPSGTTKGILKKNQLPPAEVLPFDWAKKMYLKTHESGWGKIHELIRKEAPEVFYSTINHIKKHTMYE